MKKTIFTLMSASLLLSSCGIYTKYKKADEVPQNLYGEEKTAEVSQWDATHAEADTLGLMDWRQLFTDPELQALIEKGLQQNTDYLTAQLRVKEAQAALLSAKLAYLPSLALAPQGTVSSFDHMKATQTYQLPVVASWEFDLFGRLRNAKRQSQAVLAQTKDYQQATRAAIIGGIANDKVFRTVDLYYAGDISKEECLRRLIFEEPNNQICIRTQRVLDECLTFKSYIRL